MDNSFVALDFETANNSHASACEIGLIKVKDGNIVDNFYTLIKPPENYYSKVNILVHGITPDQTVNAPYFNEIWPEIKEFIGDNFLVAHNLSFDSSILHKTAEFYDIQIPNYQGVCTYKIYGTSLTETCQSFGIERLYHNALIDAEVCALVFLNYLNGIQQDFSKCKSSNKKNPFDFSGHERIHGDCLKPDFEHGDVKCPFFKKKVVITGVFSKISRPEIAELLKEKGADIDTGVTPKTNYIISGTDPGPSKIRKFETLRNGGADIHLVSEDDFLIMIKESQHNC